MTKSTDLSEILGEETAVLRVLTRVSFDGDTTVWAQAGDSGQVESVMWDLHQVTVQQAMANRSTMLEAMAKAAHAAIKALSAAGKE